MTKPWLREPVLACFLTMGVLSLRWPKWGLLIWLVGLALLVGFCRPLGSIKLDKTVVFFLGLLAVAAPILAPYPPGLQNSEPGALAHVMGLDKLGRDIFSRLLYANRNSMIIALAGSLLACFNGVLVSAIMGLGPVWMRRLIDGFLQAVLSIPILVFYLMGLVFMEPGPFSLILLFGFTLWPNMARLVQARITELMHADFINAARMQGLSEKSIFFEEIMPNLKPVLLANFLVTLATAALLESILGYLGMGLGVGVASLGDLIRNGIRLMEVQPQVLLTSAGALLLWLMGLRGWLYRLGNRHQPLQIQ